MSLVAIDGRAVSGSMAVDTDVVVVGSGPAGGVVAERLAAAGVDVVVVEEGTEARSAEARPDSLSAMAAHYRDLGMSLVAGSAPMPFVQGRAVGGSSVVNGAICWRLPREVYDGWVADDPALADALPWALLDAETDRIEARLGVAPTAPDVAGAQERLMARGAEALGLAHRPIRRNVAGCLGAGRCLQVCPNDRKLGVDRTVLSDAVADGARVVASTRVTRVLLEGGRAVGVEARTSAGGRVTVRARRGVVLAASAVQTPGLLLASGLSRGPVGWGFSAHPGVALAGRFDERVEAWSGSSQGHEVTGLRHEGVKLETMGFDRSLVASRLPFVGQEIVEEIARLDRYAVWGAAIRAEARGRVVRWLGRPVVRYSLGRADLGRLRRAVLALGEVMLAAGARCVHPGVAGAAHTVFDHAGLVEAVHRLRSPRQVAMSITHMFGTTRMGSDPRTSVVGVDFRHHDVDGLWVADSGVFPTNLGVNPQIPIMAVAAVCASRVLEGPGDPP